MPEGKDVSALQMDTALPLGNSLDTFGRRALHVKIGNADSSPVPVTVIPGDDAGVPFFDEGADDSEANVYVELISAIVPALTTRKLSKVTVTCRLEGMFKITIGASTIGSGRTSPASPNAIFDFNPKREVSAGSTIKVKFKARPGSAVSEVEAYLMASDFT